MILQTDNLLINADGIMRTEWMSHNVGHSRNWYTGVHKYAWKWFVILNLIKVSEGPHEKIRQLKISKGTSKLEHISMQENCWRVRNRLSDFVREMFTLINDIYISKCGCCNVNVRHLENESLSLLLLIKVSLINKGSTANLAHTPLS